MRTFSPSDLCLDAGWMVHQQASPIDTNTQKHHSYIDDKVESIHLDRSIVQHSHTGAILVYFEWH